MINNDFEAIFNNIKNIAGVKKQKDLAGVLGISEAAVSDAKKNKNIPENWLKTIEEKFNVRADISPGKEPGQVSISGISYRESPEHPPGLSTEPEQPRCYVAQDFRRTCIGMLEPIIEYIAEHYGTRPSDVERFKLDFMAAMPDFRLWLYGSKEKKPAANGK